MTMIDLKEADVKKTAIEIVEELYAYGALSGYGKSMEKELKNEIKKIIERELVIKKCTTKILMKN